MNLLLGLESQPNFPREDLTDGNAAVLELLLQNGGLLLRSHQAAEAAAWLYAYAHPSARQAGQRVAAVDAHLPAFSHGISAYEAIAALVQAAPTEHTEQSLQMVTNNALKLRTVLSESALLGYMDEASEQFKAEMPRTAAVVHASAGRLQGDAAGYAIIGAGVARQFEVSAIPDDLE